MILVFIQNKIDNYIYLKQFIGYINKKHPDYVIKLNKVLYNLKQSTKI